MTKKEMIEFIYVETHKKKGLTYNNFMLSIVDMFPEYIDSKKIRKSLSYGWYRNHIKNFYRDTIPWRDSGKNNKEGKKQWITFFVEELNNEFKKKGYFVGEEKLTPILWLEIMESWEMNLIKRDIVENLVNKWISTGGEVKFWKRSKYLEVIRNDKK